MMLIVPILFVILLTMSYLQDIDQQNDTVREWASATDQLHIGIAAIHSLQETSNLLQDSQGQDAEELLFDYVEQSRLLIGSLKHPSLTGKIEEKTLSELQASTEKVKYHDDLEISQITPVLATLLPRMEYFYRSLQAQKRSIYIDSNEDINRITSQLATVSISVLGLCVLIGVILSAWIKKSTTRRLQSLTTSAHTLCNQPISGNIRKPRDELDELASCLSVISQRQLNLLATEKLLEGAEEERRRIAMDIHDQFLSDVANIARRLDDISQSKDLSDGDKKEINRTRTELAELTTHLRGIIDDVHPSALSILGLEAALRSFLQRKVSAGNAPDYYLSIETGIDEYLNENQRLNIYRIILELVSNILRHAHCSRFEINLHPIKNMLVLTVEDNGIGFDIEQALKKGQHGLLNINQRALSLQASVEWTASRFSSGSCFKMNIPVENIEMKETGKIAVHGI
ncbi:MAG: ATP-binding protein [Gammaproteobacteria bacterium]